MYIACTSTSTVMNARRRVGCIIVSYHRNMNHDGEALRHGKKAMLSCIRRESNPELGHGKTQCYRYTIHAM